MNNTKSLEITPSKRFFNYLQISNAVKSTDPEISFFIKAYAFRQAYDLISSNKASQDTFHNFSSLYFVFKKEVAFYDESKMTKELFAKFLEKYYLKLEFKTLDVLYRSRDLLEIMHSFGPFDELTTRRSILISIILLYSGIF